MLVQECENSKNYWEEFNFTVFFLKKCERMQTLKGKKLTENFVFSYIHIKFKSR